MFYFYIVQNEEKGLYYGSTSNLKRRLKEHQEGVTYATKGHTWKLFYYEAYEIESDARQREQMVKLDGRVKAGLKRRLSL